MGARSDEIDASTGKRWIVSSANLSRLAPFSQNRTIRLSGGRTLGQRRRIELAGRQIDHPALLTAFAQPARDYHHRLQIRARDRGSRTITIEVVRDENARCPQVLPTNQVAASSRGARKAPHGPRDHPCAVTITRLFSVTTWLRRLTRRGQCRQRSEIAFGAGWLPRSASQTRPDRAPSPTRRGSSQCWAPRRNPTASRTRSSYADSSMLSVAGRAAMSHLTIDAG